MHSKLDGTVTLQLKYIFADTLHFELRKFGHFLSFVNFFTGKSVHSSSCNFFIKSIFQIKKIIK